MVKVINITNRCYYQYAVKPGDDVDTLVTAIKAGEDIWYEFQDGARTGTIGKVLDHNKWSVGSGLYLPDNSFTVDIGNDKTLKVAVKSYHNKFKFLVGYTGTYVNFFQKGKAKAKPTETKKPDLLGNTVKVGDWVIFSHKRGGTGLGRLNRLSEAGNAWVMTPDRHGKEYELMTEGAGSLIKVNMTPELHSTVMLCDSLQAVRTKLVIDLDHEAYM